MFMQRNRAKMGFEDPAARSDESDQAGSEALVPVIHDLGQPQERLFEPNLETIAAISARHKDGWKTDTYGGPTYENKIPVGPCMP